MFIPNPNEEYEVVPVDHSVHSANHPFCDDSTCPDKEDTDAIGELNQMYQDGTLTAGEASDIHAGKPNNYGW